jgi:hypothetical protein
MICRIVNVASFAILACGVTCLVRAQAIATYDENSPSFLVGSYDEPGVVTQTSESILIDVPSDDDTFGIAGTLYSPSVDFDPDEYLWELRLRVLAGNETPVLDTIYSDHDEGVAVDEGWVFRFDLSTYTRATIGSCSDRDLTTQLFPAWMTAFKTPVSY